MHGSNWRKILPVSLLEPQITSFGTSVIMPILGRFFSWMVWCISQDNVDDSALANSFSISVDWNKTKQKRFISCSYCMFSKRHLGTLFSASSSSSLDTGWWEATTGYDSKWKRQFWRMNPEVIQLFCQNVVSLNHRDPGSTILPCCWKAEGEKYLVRCNNDNHMQKKHTVLHHRDQERDFPGILVICY